MYEIFMNSPADSLRTSVGYLTELNAGRIIHTNLHPFLQQYHQCLCVWGSVCSCVYKKIKLKRWPFVVRRDTDEGVFRDRPRRVGPIEPTARCLDDNLYTVAAAVKWNWQ